MTDYRRHAEYLIKKGISVTPLTADGSKKSKIKWEQLRTRFLSPWEIDLYCKECGGLAAITGGFSKLVCIDFDLDKQLPSQDYWKGFCERIPSSLKKKFRINETRSGGKHVWFRAEDFCDVSRKITHRYKTIPEIYKEYLSKKDDPATSDEKVQTRLLNRPVKCIIETRFEGSYAVLVHPDYKVFYGDKINPISYEEWKLMEEVLYSLDCGFSPRSKYSGDAGVYAVIGKYNSDTDAESVCDMMLSTGGYSLHRIDSLGNRLLKREGSNNDYSCKVFFDTGNIMDFGESNIFTDEKKIHTPFELFCAINSFNEDEAIDKLKEIYDGRR